MMTKSHAIIPALCAALVLLGSAARAGAQPDAQEPRAERLDIVPDAHAYALVVGSNAGSPGQEPLEFAERDAERIAEVLVELGRYPASRVDLLRAPTRAQLTGALGRLRQRLAVHSARGEQAVVFFYYSGHAQAQALRLGREEFPLNELRTAIDTLPTTLTLVVLDACQSGAYSRVRGTDPAADFSHNSLRQLQTRGVAIMASSTGDELSQESERLSAGYFTHHLLVALRGVADENRDGRVALDEAYRYAYAQTLADTSRTAVGGQHVTLVTNLTGHGAVALTYPARGSAHLELPADLTGQLLITHSRTDAVMAELTKARGAAVRLALPAGRYQVLWREDGVMRSCTVTLTARGTHTLNASGCNEITADEATAREAHAGPVTPWGIELGLGATRSHETRSAYTERLEAFGYGPPFQWFDYETNWMVGVSATFERMLTGPVSLLLTFDSIDRRSFDRGVFSENDDTYSWRAWAVGVQLRGTFRFAGNWLYGYAQGGAGLGIARTRFNPGRDQEPTVTQVDYGVVLSAALGLRFMPWDHVGFYVQGGYSFAPILQNDLGDRHDSGGFSFAHGLRVQF